MWRQILIDWTRIRFELAWLNWFGMSKITISQIKKSCFLGYTRFNEWAHNISLKENLYLFLKCNFLQIIKRLLIKF